MIPIVQLRLFTFNFTTMSEEKKTTIKNLINLICTILSAIAAAICTSSCISHI